MSQSPENPGGFKPPGAPNAQQHPGQPDSPHEPIGGFGLNLPPGVSTDVYQDQQAQVEGMGKSSTAVVSLVFGILALVLNFCCGIFGLVFGLVAIATGIVTLNAKEARSGDRTMAITGIVLGAIAMLLWVLLLILGFGMSMLSP